MKSKSLNSVTVKHLAWRKKIFWGYGLRNHQTRNSTISNLSLSILGNKRDLLGAKGKSQVTPKRPLDEKRLGAKRFFRNGTFLYFLISQSMSFDLIGEGDTILIRHHRLLQKNGWCKSNSKSSRKSWLATSERLSFNSQFVSFFHRQTTVHQIQIFLQPPISPQFLLNLLSS